MALSIRLVGSTDSVPRRHSGSTATHTGNGADIVDQQPFSKCIPAEQFVNGIGVRIWVSERKRVLFTSSVRLECALNIVQ